MIARLLVLTALAGALWAAYMGWEGHQRAIDAAEERAVWIAAMDAQKAEARKQLDAANARVATAEDAAQLARETQNAKDTQNAKITSELERRLLAAGRLRDPNAARCGGSGASGGATGATSPGLGADNLAETPGLLSAEISGLLRTVTAEADAVNLAYIASRADADQLRGLLGAACGMPKP